MCLLVTHARLFSVYHYFMAGFVALLVCGGLVSSAGAKVYKINSDRLDTHKSAKSNLQNLIDKGVLKPGDRVVLETGYYGSLTIKSLRNKGFISIVAGRGQSPKFHSIQIHSSSNWVLKGLTVSPSFKKDYTRYSTLVSVSGQSKAIALEGLNLFSVKDISRWSLDNWKNLAADGIIVRDSSHVTIRKNRLTNINHGIFVDGHNALVAQNRIENFSGKAISGHGNYSVYQGNYIKNCYVGGRGNVGGLVFWLKPVPGANKKPESFGGVIRANTIVNSDIIKSRPLCKMPGIRLRGGFFVQWLIENNVVVPSHWSGISIRGGRNVIVMHNTVFNPYAHNPNAAQISIWNVGKGKSSNNIIINNISQDFGGDRLRQVQVGNLKVENAQSYFVDPFRLNFRLRRGSRAVDAAATTRYFAVMSNVPSPRLPDEDVLGTKRPQGSGRDVGAYEFTQQ